MTIRPVGAEIFHADGQTDRQKLIFAFRNFVSAPKNMCLPITGQSIYVIIIIIIIIQNKTVCVFYFGSVLTTSCIG